MRSTRNFKIRKDSYTYKTQQTSKKHSRMKVNEIANSSFENILPVIRKEGTYRRIRLPETGNQVYVQNNNFHAGPNCNWEAAHIKPPNQNIIMRIGESASTSPQRNYVNLNHLNTNVEMGSRNNVLKREFNNTIDVPGTNLRSSSVMNSNKSGRGAQFKKAVAVKIEALRKGSLTPTRRYTEQMKVPQISSRQSKVLENINKSITDAKIPSGMEERKEFKINKKLKLKQTFKPIEKLQFKTNFKNQMSLRKEKHQRRESKEISVSPPRRLLTNLKSKIVDKESIAALEFRIRTLVKTFEGELKTILFKSKEIYMDDFTKKLISIFGNSVKQETIQLFSRYLFEPRVKQEIEEYNRTEQTKFIETRLRKFAGQYEVIHDSSIEVFRLYFQHKDNKEKKKEFFEALDALKTFEFVTPYEIHCLVSECKVEVDAQALCTLLLRKSLSLTHIKGSVISEYLIPSLQAKIVREEPVINILPLKKSSEYEKYNEEKPFEEMSKEEQEERRQQFCMKLADFLFVTNNTLQSVMLPKIFDKVIDGTEYRLIKYRHFVRLIKRKGLGLSYNDEQCIKSIVQEVLPNCINISGLEHLLVTLGIEDEKPAQSKHLDYTKITGSTIRIFNKINHDMNEMNLTDIIEFLGKENLDSIEAEIGGATQSLLVIKPQKLRSILCEKGIINYGQDLDDDFIDFVSIGNEGLIAIRKLKRILSDISRCQYYQSYGCNFREEYSIDSDVEDDLDKPLESPVKRCDSNLSINKLRLSKNKRIKMKILSRKKVFDDQDDDSKSGDSVSNMRSSFQSVDLSEEEDNDTFSRMKKKQKMGMFTKNL